MLVCVDAVHALGVEPDAVLGCDFLVGCHKWLFGPAAPAWSGAGATLGRGHRHRPAFNGAAIGAWIRAAATPAPARPCSSRAASTPTSTAGPWPRRSGSTWTWASGRSPTAPTPWPPASRTAWPRSRRSGWSPPRPGPVGRDRLPEVGAHNPGEVVADLRRQGILASVTPYAQPYLRLGPSIVTSEEDVDAAVAAVPALA